MKIIEFVENQQLDEKCWDTHKQVGMKKKGSRMVPDCRLKEQAVNAAQHPQELEMDAQVKAMQIQQRADQAEKELTQRAAQPRTLGQKIAKDIGDPLKKLAKGDIRGALGEDDKFNSEYNDEAGMADNNLETLRRTVDGIDDLISAGDNLPEWCQEKIATSKSMLVAVRDYMQSEQQREVTESARRMSRAAKGYKKYGKEGMLALSAAGQDGASEEKMDAIRDKHDKYNENTEVLDRLLVLGGVELFEHFQPDQQFDIVEQMVEELAEEHAVDAEVIWEDFESVPDIELYETAAWRRKEGKNKKGGLNAKGVASYRRENPGSKLQTAVTTKPSKLKPGSKAAKRRKSFCARMSGVKGPMKKPNGKPSRKALALRKWNC